MGVMEMTRAQLAESLEELCASIMKIVNDLNVRGIDTRRAPKQHVVKARAAWAEFEKRTNQT